MECPKIVTDEYVCKTNPVPNFVKVHPQSLWDKWFLQNVIYRS